MSQENVAFVQELHERWERGDFATAECFDPAVEFVRIGTWVGEGVWRGVDEMWGAIAGFLRAWEGFRVEARRYIDVDAERVLVLEHQTAKGRRSGLDFDREVGQLFTIRDRRIVRWQNYWDTDEALEAVGLRE